MKTFTKRYKLFPLLAAFVVLLFLSGCNGSDKDTRSVAVPVEKVVVTSTAQINRVIVTQSTLPTIVNNPPLAIAQNIKINQGIKYYGQLRATDSDGDALTYEITQPTTKGRVTINANGTFIYICDESGVDSFKFRATDSVDQSAEQTVSVEVTQNQIALPNAPTDFTAIRIDATSAKLQWQDNSDDEDYFLIFDENWDLLGVSNRNTTEITLTELDPNRDYSFILKARNQSGHRGRASALLMAVETQILPPIANAGLDQNISIDDIIVLDGTGSSDINGDTLTYTWSVISKPVDSLVSISDLTSVTPTFTANKAGEYILQLIVSDGVQTSAPDIVKIIQSPIYFGTVSGTVKDAVTGNGVVNLTINIREGSGVHTGDIFRVIAGDTNGNYSISDLPEGAYTIEAIADNYITGYFTVNSIANQVNDNQNHTLSPILQEGEVRIVLTWSENPRDLDSHLTGPDGVGNRFHVYYSNRTGEGANLDLDDTTSYGPETITITQQHDGDYLYYIYNFSVGSLNALTSSDAKVEVYKGSSIIATYNVPIGEGYYWTVFSLNNNQITEINTIGEKPL